MSDEIPIIPTQPGDLPIERLAQDALGWRKYIFALMRTLERAETPFVLGVYGGWGSGKTSFVNCLADAAQTKQWPKRRQMEVEDPETEPHLYQWRVVHVNPWECDTAEDAKRLVTTSLWAQCFDRSKWWSVSGMREKLRALGRRHDEAAAGALDVAGGASHLGDVGTAVNGFFASDASLGLTMRRHFSQDLELALGRKADGTFKRRLLVVIDDLDRCREEIIPEVLETIKLYLNQPGCVFVLAADPERVGRVLGAG